MHYDLDLAIAYACALGLFCWLASWLIPLAFSTAYGATAAWVDTHRRGGPRGTPRPSPTARTAHSDWWGPTHQS